MTRLLAALAFGLALAQPTLAETKPLVAGSMADIRAAHSGKPNVIALWSTDCPPCHAELAMLGAWRRTHPDARLVLISTDVNETTATAETLLRQYGLDAVESWIFADPFVERLRHEIDPTWRGELPRTYLSDGRESLAISGKLERPRLDAWWRSVAGD